MSTAYIVDAVRTAGGKKNGRLSQIHPVDLGATILNALVDRTGIEPAAIDDVIFGCVSQIGPQTFNLARTVILASELPDSVPGVTVDRQCGSGQQAIHFAAQAIMSGTQDVIIAGGSESMSMVPIGATYMASEKAGMAGPFDSVKLQEKYPGSSFNQFDGAEKVAAKYAVTRDMLDNFAYGSHVKAAAACEAGKFDNEIIPIEITVDGERHLHQVDEGIRFNPVLSKLQSLQPILDNGIITAAAASQICDGASAVLVVSEKALKEHNLTPLAKIHSMAVVGSDPEMVLEGPIPCTKKILKQSGLSISDIGIYEVNEAFGSIPLAWCNALQADISKLNVNGGAQALGHPLGATGAKLMTTLMYEMRRRGDRFGLLAICEGLGTANATIIENLF